MAVSHFVTITECPRDSFQGLRKFIPTDEKITYMNALVSAGVRRIDFGSFVSPKAVPQMADTAVVFENMNKPDDLYLIAIIGNEKGLEGILACNSKHLGRGRIAAAGYPLSVSETFQQRNLGRGLDQSWREFETIAGRARAQGIGIICYLSMAFGNPYDEPYDPVTVVEFARRAAALGATAVSLADTVGNATPRLVSSLFEDCRMACPGTVVTAHFHSRPENFSAKVDAALNAGCRLIDSALAGVGGCPFAKDDLTGNVDTLLLLEHLASRGFETGLDVKRLARCATEAAVIAKRYG